MPSSPTPLPSAALVPEVGAQQGDVGRPALRLLPPVAEPAEQGPDDAPAGRSIVDGQQMQEPLLPALAGSSES